jgi:nucleotidyltransferase/DNA polymerase involved in DNA repair
VSKLAVKRQMPHVARVDVNCFYASAERAFNRLYLHKMTLFVRGQA